MMRGRRRVRPANPKTGYSYLVARFKRRILRAALKRSGGSVMEAAYRLSVNRTDFYDLLNKHGVDPEEFR